MSIDLYLEQNINAYKHAFDTTDQFIAILDDTMCIQTANRALLNLINLELDTIVGMPYWELSLWAHSEEIQNMIMFAIEQIYFGEELKFETTYVNTQDEIKYLEVSIKSVNNQDGEIESILAMGYDITNIKLTKKELHRTEKELESFFNTSIDGYIIRTLNKPVEIDYNDAQELLEKTIFNEIATKHNKAFEDILEIPQEFFDGKYLFNNAKIYIKLEDLLELFKLSILNGHVKFEKSFITKNKSKIYIELYMIPLITDGMYLGTFYTVRDITSTKMYQEQLFKLANFDSLTSVANRRYFMTNVHKIIENEYFDKGVMCVFDIDNFKMVNDNFGHDIGDIALKKISSVMDEIVKDYGIFARLGGEEFSAFLRCDIHTGVEILEKIFNAVRVSSIKLDNTHISLKITVSAGITEVNKGEKFNDFFKRADQSLYIAKNSGKNKFCISEDV